MSNAYDEFLPDDQSDKEVTEGGQLRKKLKDAIALLKEKDKQLSELTAQHAGRLVEEFLAKNEVPAKFHKLAKKELGDTPDEDAFKNFLTEYGDLWDAEGSEEETVNPERDALQDGLEKIHNAARSAKNLGPEPFKMPSQYELSRMNENDIAKLMASIPQK